MLRWVRSISIPYQNLINLYLVQCAEEKETLRPNPATGITVLPAWMDAPEDEGLYDDLV